MHPSTQRPKAIASAAEPVVRLDGLRSIRTSISLTSGLAHDISSSAVQHAADSGCKARRNGGGSRGAGDRGLRHSKYAGNKGEDDSGVLHCDCWGWAILDGTVRWMTGIKL
jgi:hypothetical protein